MREPAKSLPSDPPIGTVTIPAKAFAAALAVIRAQRLAKAPNVRVRVSVHDGKLGISWRDRDTQASILGVGAGAPGSAACYLRPVDLLRVKIPKSSEVAIALGKTVSVRAGVVMFELPVENLAQWAPPEELRWEPRRQLALQLPRADLAWLDSARSRDVSREALSHVFSASRELAAMSGHRLHRRTTTPALPAGLIPGEAWATALACAKAFSSKTIELAHGSVDGTPTWRLTGAGLGYSWTVTALDIAAGVSYPDTTALVPKSPSQSCVCDAEGLRAALDACATICRKESNLTGAPTLVHDGAHLRVTAADLDSSKVDACIPAAWTGGALGASAPIFNPFYMLDAIEGAIGPITLASDWDECALLRIDYGERTIVIAPMRK
jgi:hypothetical protein